MFDLTENEDGSEYEFDKRQPSKLLEKGAVFGLKEMENGHMFLQDYVCESAAASVLCIKSFDFQIVVEKHLMLEK